MSKSFDKKIYHLQAFWVAILNLILAVAVFAFKIGGVPFITLALVGVFVVNFILIMKLAYQENEKGRNA